jgi:hypothetical protein
LTLEKTSTANRGAAVAAVGTANTPSRTVRQTTRTRSDRDIAALLRA